MHNIIDELAREEMLDQMVPGRTDRRNRHALERAEEKRKKKLRERLNSQLKPCPVYGGGVPQPTNTNQQSNQKVL